MREKNRSSFEEHIGVAVV